MSSILNRHWKTLLVLILLFIPLIIAGTWSSLTNQITPQPSGQLTVMTYNIREGFGVDNRLDLNAILATIQAENPDILVLQEIDYGVIMSGSTDQARWLSQQLNMYLAPITFPDHIWGSDAILSKYPISHYESIVMQSPSEDDTLLRADVEVNGQQVSIYAVHFTTFSSADRRIQADVGIPWVMSTGGLKIWAGDFNVDAYTTDPVDQSIYSDITTYLNDSFEVALSRTGNLTSPTINPTGRIDYVFVTPTITVLSHNVPHSLASDHLPVVAQLQLPASPLNANNPVIKFIRGLQVRDEYFLL